MKNVAAFVLVSMVLSGTIGFLIGSSSFASAGGGGGKGGGVPAGNGDVNGDGSLDISDVAYLVNALYLGGPAPVAIEWPPAVNCPTDGRFIDNGDGTITDTCTRLMWQRETADGNGDGQVVDDESDALYWRAALAYCENLVFADHDDWRLPDVLELKSIVDYGRLNPSIDPVFSSFSRGYWSSTSHVGYSGEWVVFFVNGQVALREGDHYSVRAVRFAQ
jgi:uncharacterized protein DUF1566